MKKEINRDGPNGKQTGEVIIHKNSGSKTVKQYNPVWHDSKQVRVKTSKVISNANGKPYKEYNDITRDSDIETQAALAEQELIEHLENLATRDNTTFEDKMKDKGFK